jgi:hypothetical protein
MSEPRPNKDRQKLVHFNVSRGKGVASLIFNGKLLDVLENET